MFKKLGNVTIESIVKNSYKQAIVNNLGKAINIKLNTKCHV